MRLSRTKMSQGVEEVEGSLTGVWLVRCWHGDGGKVKRHVTGMLARAQRFCKSVHSHQPTTNAHTSGCSQPLRLLRHFDNNNTFQVRLEPQDSILVMAVASEQSESRLLRLPPEIRNLIWEYAVQHDPPFLGGPTAICLAPPSVKHTATVTQTCRQMRSESRAMYFARNSFFYQLGRSHLSRAFLVRQTLINLRRTRPDGAIDSLT